MANIGTLAVKLVANTQQFVGGLRGAAGSVASFGSSALTFARSAAGAITGAITAITKAFAVVTGAITLAVGAFVWWQKTIFDAAGDMADNAARVGMTIEALAGFEYAAERAGASAEILQNGLQRMLKTVSDAASGNKKAQQSFRALGLDINKVLRMNTEQQFLAIADAMKKMSSVSDRMRLASDIFGRGSAGKLMVMLSGGRAEIEAMTEEAKRFGLAWDAKGLWGIKAASEQLSRITALIKGIGRQIAIQIGPYVEALASKFVELALSAGDIGPVVLSAFESMVMGIVKASSVLKEMIKYFYVAKLSVLELARQFHLLRIAVLKFGGSIGINVKKDLEAAQKELDTVTGWMISTMFKGAVTLWKFPTEEEVKTFFDGVRAEAAKNAEALQRAAMPDMGEVEDALEDINQKANQIAGQGYIALNIARNNWERKNKPRVDLTQLGRNGAEIKTLGLMNAIAARYNSIAEIHQKVFSAQVSQLEKTWRLEKQLAATREARIQRNEDLRAQMGKANSNPRQAPRNGIMQQVRDPQLQEVVRQLREIKNEMRNSGVARYA